MIRDRSEQEWTEEPDELEVYFVDGQTSGSKEDLGCTPDWSASECTDYKACALAPVACASPQTTLHPLHDTWEWRGPCYVVRALRQVRRYLYTPTWEEESVWQGLTVQPQRITHVAPTGQQNRNLLIENVKTRECLRPMKVAYLWTSETHCRVASTAQSKNVFGTSSYILAQ